MRYIGYYRVSTEQQGNSGLGLNAQKKSVRTFCRAHGELLQEFTDIESGKSDDRLNLQLAIKACIDTNSTLVVKNLSRISRGGFKVMVQLEEAGVEYIESSSPHDTQLIKEIKFSMARDERKKISERTSSALQAIKDKIDRGEVHISNAGNVITSLGNPQNLTDEARRKGNAVKSNIAYQRSKQAGAFAVALHRAGQNGAEITDALNDAGFTTPKGKQFTRTQTHRLLKRYGSKQK